MDRINLGAVIPGGCSSSGRHGAEVVILRNTTSSTRRPSWRPAEFDDTALNETRRQVAPVRFKVDFVTKRNFSFHLAMSSRSWIGLYDPLVVRRDGSSTKRNVVGDDVFVYKTTTTPFNPSAVEPGRNSTRRVWNLILPDRRRASERSVDESDVDGEIAANENSCVVSRQLPSQQHAWTASIRRREWLSNFRNTTLFIQLFTLNVDNNIK